MHLILQIRTLGTLIGHDASLGQAHCIAHTQGIALGITGKQVAHEMLVHQLVLRGEHGAGSTIEGKRSTIGIEHSLLSYIGHKAIEGHHITGCSDPQGQILAARTGKILGLEHILVTEGIGCPMAGIVHHECSILHLLAQEGGNLGIGVALDGAHTLVGIPIDLVQLHRGVGHTHLLSHLVGTAHVTVVVAVIAQHIDEILPRTGIGAGHKGDALIHHHLGFLLGGDREAAYAHIHLLYERIGTLAVVEQTEVVLHHIAEYVAETVVALIAEQIVVGRIGLPSIGNHTVVPGAITHEKQIAGSFCIGACTVVEHLQEAAVSRSVRRSARELIVYLVGTEDAHSQSVMFCMGIGQALSLPQELAAGGDDDDHIQTVGSMQILVLYLSQVGGFGVGMAHIEGNIACGRV